MAAKRKVVEIRLRVSVPKWASAAMARKEVRSRINDLCGYYDFVSGPRGEGQLTLRARSVERAPNYWRR
jgi:hypothetical protein